MFFAIIQKDTQELQIVDELTDFLWQEGWRRFETFGVSNSKVNIHEVDEFVRQTSISQHGF